MLNFYHSLDETNRLRYAALESRKLGHGGKKYIKELLGTSYDSISKGLSELTALDLSTSINGYKEKRTNRLLFQR